MRRMNITKKPKTVQISMSHSDFESLAAALDLVNEVAVDSTSAYNDIERLYKRFIDAYSRRKVIEPSKRYQRSQS